MLTVTVKADPGANLRDVMVEMLKVAGAIGARVELRANGSTFWVDPSDTVNEVQAAFDRLYGKSDYVSVRIPTPNPKAPEHSHVFGDSGRCLICGAPPFPGEPPVISGPLP